MMKRIVWLASVAAVAIMPVLAQAAGTGEASKYEQKKQTLAVFDFKAKSTGLEAEAAKLTEEATRLLSELKRFNVRDIDPNNMTKAMKELELQMTGATKEENIKVGQIEGYNKAITGSLVEFKITKPGFFDRKKEYTANIEVIVKVIDLSDMTVKVEKISASKADENEATAVKEAYNQIFMWMKLQFRKWFPIEVFIPEVEGSQATLYVGDNMGVYPGMKFRIFNIETKERKDGKISTKKIEQGTIKVNGVSETESTAVWVRGRGPQAEDWVSELPMIGLMGAIGGGVQQLKLTYGGSYTNQNFDGLSPVIGLEAEYGASWWRIGLDINFIPGNFTVLGLEERIKFGINLDLLGELVQLEIAPFIGIAEAAQFGASYLSYNFWYLALTVGGGGYARVRIGISDMFALSIQAGYKYYLPINGEAGGPFLGWSLYESSTETWFVGRPWWLNAGQLPSVDFSGVEAQVKFEAYF